MVIRDSFRRTTWLSGIHSGEQHGYQGFIHSGEQHGYRGFILVNNMGYQGCDNPCYNIYVCMLALSFDSGLVCLYVCLYTVLRVFCNSLKVRIHTTLIFGLLTTTIVTITWQVK